MTSAGERRELGALLEELRRLADAVLGARDEPRAARLHALVHELGDRLSGDDGAAAGEAPEEREAPAEVVELLVVGSGAPLSVSAVVADAVWNTMFVTEATRFVDVVLADGGVARIRPSAVTGFRYHPGTTPPAQAPKRGGRA